MKGRNAQETQYLYVRTFLATSMPLRSSRGSVKKKTIDRTCQSNIIFRVFNRDFSFHLLGVGSPKTKSIIRTKQV